MAVNEPAIKKSKVVFYDEEEYALRKRLPHKLPKRINDVYVTNKTDFNCQVENCKKLFQSGENEIYIHGLGNAVTRAINMALKVQGEYGQSLEMWPHTTTETLIDDFEPLKDELECETAVRNNSAIHIKLYRTHPVDFKSKPTQS